MLSFAVNPVLYFKTIFQLGLSHRQAKTSIGWAEPDMWEGSTTFSLYISYIHHNFLKTLNLKAI
jgi:hypothetical protein